MPDRKENSGIESNNKTTDSKRVVVHESTNRSLVIAQLQLIQKRRAKAFVLRFFVQLGNSKCPLGLLLCELESALGLLLREDN